MNLKRTLMILSAVVILGAVIYWAASGANRGFSKNRVEVRTLDEVTGIEGITYRDQFVPGVDFLAGAVVISGLLTAASFYCRKRETSKAVPSS